MAGNPQKINTFTTEGLESLMHLRERADHRKKRRKAIALEIKDVKEDIYNLITRKVGDEMEYEKAMQIREMHVHIYELKQTLKALFHEEAEDQEIYGNVSGWQSSSLS